MPNPRFKDHFSSVATGYSKYRPDYPEELFGWLARQAPSRGIAWDCATGSGQAALHLTRHFDLVVATDASPSQLLQGKNGKNLYYLASLAEAPPFRPASLDLLTVAQALHWFELERFFREACRVLKEGGVIAVWSYNLLRIEPAIDRQIKRLYSEILDAYWPPERRLVEGGYRGIPFPFREVRPPTFMMSVDWRADQLLGYLSTWSAVQRYRVAKGSDPLDLVRSGLLEAWGDPGRSRRIGWPLNLRVGINGS